MSRQPFRVVFADKWLVLVSGYGSRELLAELRGGKAPMWNVTRRAWATTPRTAADFIAVAESRDLRVVIVDESEPLLFGADDAQDPAVSTFTHGDQPERETSTGRPPSKSPDPYTLRNLDCGVMRGRRHQKPSRGALNDHERP